jgi:anti-anti-sigma factor
MTKTKSSSTKSKKRSTKTKSKAVSADSPDSSETPPQDDVLIVAPEDGLCETGVAAFQSDLRQAVNAGPTTFTIDLSNISEIDGQGLALLTQCQNSLNERGSRLVVVASHPDWRELLEATGLCEHFAVQETL